MPVNCAVFVTASFSAVVPEKEVASWGQDHFLRLPTIMTLDIQVNARPVRQKLLQLHSVTKAAHLAIEK